MKRGVILDIDGTLVDSNDAHALAWVEALGKYDFHIPFERIRPLIGMGGDKIIPELTGWNKDSPEGRLLAKTRQEIFFSRHLQYVQPLPGVRPLIERLESNGVRLAVATSADEAEVTALLEVAGIEDLIHRRQSSEGRESKPDPDVVQAALSELSLPPEEVVMIGDTPYDIAAAIRAGISVIAFRSGGWSDEHFAGALAIYDEPGDLLAHFDTSPLVRSHGREETASISSPPNHG
jgi:HAD superfamily hydrolase (TIGR01509 family)